MREDLRSQFSSDTDPTRSPAFRTRPSPRRSRWRASRPRACSHGRKLEAMKLEVAELNAEKEKLVEIAAVPTGTAKGRTYEEAVFGARRDRLRTGRRLRLRRRRPRRGRARRLVISIDACSGPTRGRIVFEAKNSRKSRKGALAISTRRSSSAARTSRSSSSLRRPAAGEHRRLREFNGDKLFVVFDPEDPRAQPGVRLPLARARVLDGPRRAQPIDPAAIRAEIERADLRWRTCGG